MKLHVKILICIFGLVTSLLLLTTCFNNTTTFIEKIAEIIGINSSNLLENGDFKDDFKGWKYNKNSSVLLTNGISCACINGNDKTQTRIWQEINVVSGQTYNLTFTLTGPSKGAFAIYRDTKTGKEKYIWCNGKNKNKHYDWEFVPINTGKNLLFLSTSGNGLYYFSNVKLRKYNEIIKFFYTGIAIIIIVFLTYYNGMFFLIIFSLTFIPILRMTKDTKSISENRMLAEYKPIFGKNKELNINFGSDFNNWINDHFWLRNDFMKIQNSLCFLIDKKVDNKFVSQGNDKWLFLKGNFQRLAKPTSYYDGIYSETANAIKRFNEFCEKKNAKLYIIVAPFGEELYSSEVVGVDITKKIGLFGKYIDQLKKDTKANIIYAYEPMKKAKEEGLVQYKTDHHWTELGAYNAYKVLRKEIFRDFNITQAYQTAFKTQSKKYDFGYGETFGRIRNISDTIAKQLFPKDVTYIKFIPDKNLVIEDNGSLIINKNGAKQKIFLFGDSYTRNIKNFFGYDFANTIYQVKPLQIFMPQFEEQITKHKPNIVVMIIYSQNFERIKNWYKSIYN